jgi:hypothetical protein
LPTGTAAEFVVWRRFWLKLSLVAIPVVALLAWFARVEDGGPWLLRNLLPPVAVLLLAAYTLYRGEGRWTASGWTLPLATAGFAIPGVGLSAYLHYAYTVNLDGMFDAGAGELFRFLPVYTSGAGLIGFLIGWIVGRNVN